MLTDWVLIRRLARELDERLRGARVEDAGLLADGRIALLLRKLGQRVLLAIDLFASPPVVTLEDGDLAVTTEPGFLRAVSRSLHGMVLSGVTTRRNDRLLRLSFSARSRFGVGDECDLFLELVPRFGNLVLVKGDRVVAACKEFAPSENARRSVRTGDPYVLPPLPDPVRTLSPVVDLENGETSQAPLHVYRDAGKLLQAYVVALDRFDRADHTLEASLLDILGELRTQQSTSKNRDRSDRRRQAILKRLEARETKLRGELESLRQKRNRAEHRDALRSEGDEIFATLYQLPESERDSAKDRASKLFVQYKKLMKSLPHIAERERTVSVALEGVETLRWEAERAADEDLSDVEVAVGMTSSMTTAAPTRAGNRRRRLLELRTERGSRIVIGRSPMENAELTFRLARPNDLWFHARGIPGAHVILARDDRTNAPDDDLQVAASLAAFYSKARTATSVAIDYTLRKHVRKQRAAAPGLVWYTHAQTILAAPQSLDALRAVPAG